MDTVDVEVEEVLRETEKSIEVLTHDGDRVWLPKSQLENGARVEVGDACALLILPRWLAIKRGLL